MTNFFYIARYKLTRTSTANKSAEKYHCLVTYVKNT